MGILDIKNTLLAALLGVAVGIGVGFYVKSEFFKADQVEAVKDAQSETADGIQESLRSSAATAGAVANANQQVAVIRKAVAARIQPKEIPNEASPRHVCRNDLDVGTVRLLNAARDGTALDATGISDGTSKTASGIGMPELLDDDLEVVGLYRALAIKHNSLVDYVESLVKKQADQ